MKSLVAAVERLDPLTVSGRVAAVNGLLIEARGGLTRLAVGARAEIGRYGESPLQAEVVGFRDTRALLMPFGPVEGVAPGAEIRIEPLGSAVRPTKAWLGRIVDAFGNPIDGKGPLAQGIAPYPLRAPPPSAHARARVGDCTRTLRRHLGESPRTYGATSGADWKQSRGLDCRHRDVRAH